MADLHGKITPPAHIHVKLSSSGPKGEPFRYEDFTPEQLEALRGPKGDKGEDGFIKFEELTPEQKEELRGPQGIPGYTPQKGIDYFDGEKGETGEKGDPFKYEDFTPEQLEGLRGPKGEDGYTPIKGVDYFDGEPGPKGDKPVKGVDYWTQEDVADVAAQAGDLAKTAIEPTLAEKADKTYVDNVIQNLELAEIVDELPEEGKTNKLYLVARTEAQDDDIFNEFLWVNDTWEYVGSMGAKIDIDSLPKDIQINGVSILDSDKVANIPIASDSNVGVVKANSEYGLYVNPTSGLLTLAPASESYISAKTNNYRPITPKTVDYAVKSGLAYSKIEWTDTEKTNAQARIGLSDTASKTYVDNNLSNRCDGLANQIEGLSNQLSTEVDDIWDELDSRPTDIQINGTSIVNDGVANIPIAKNKLGLIQIDSYFNVNVDSTNGKIYPSELTKENYDKANGKSFVSKTTLENVKYDVVKQAMCDGKGAEWTDEEKTMAQQRMGILSSEGVLF